MDRATSTNSSGWATSRAVPDPACSDQEWTSYLFIEDNLAGEVDEWWIHAPSNNWFIARRNRLTDEDSRGPRAPTRLFCGTQIMTADRTRLPADGWGLLLDRTQPVAFTFRRRLARGFSGDVVASALMASGRHVMSRSFKYHRPRGVLTMAGHDSNTLVQVGAEPNVRGDRRRIAPGLAVTSINRLGCAGLRLARRARPVLPIPARRLLLQDLLPPAWRMARCSSGRSGRWRDWGRSTRKRITAITTKQHLFCDVLVVGGGPAGLNAAIAAAEAGAEVLLIDEWPIPGGSLLFGRTQGSRAEAEAKRLSLLSRALAHPPSADHVGHDRQRPVRRQLGVRAQGQPPLQDPREADSAGDRRLSISRSCLPGTTFPASCSPTPRNG